MIYIFPLAICCEFLFLDFSINAIICGKEKVFSSPF